MHWFKLIINELLHQLIIKPFGADEEETLKKNSQHSATELLVVGAQC